LRGAATRTRLTACASIAVLLLAAVFSSAAAQHAAWIWFAVCAGAVRIAFAAAAGRQYVWAALFAGLALLYNPVVPPFELAGREALVLLLAGAAPFIASLFLLKPRLEQSVAGA